MLQKIDCDSEMEALDVITFQILQFLVLKSAVSLDAGCLKLEICRTQGKMVLLVSEDVMSRAVLTL